MHISKTILVMLSIILCFSVLCKQANASYGMDLDIPSYLDKPEIEAYGDHDSNEVTTLVVPHLMPSIQNTVQPVVLATSYRQPAPPPLLRPPTL